MDAVGIVQRDHKSAEDEKKVDENICVPDDETAVDVQWQQVLSEMMDHHHQAGHPSEPVEFGYAHQPEAKVDVQENCYVYIRLCCIISG
jgi:hypothetical protein